MPYIENDPINKIYQVSSQFYPVDSGIMIEDHNTKVSMVVMNDRP